MPAPEKPRPSIHFLGRTIYDHVLLKLKAIRSSDLENTLRFLNYKQAFSLLYYLEHYLRNVQEIELSTRACLFLIKGYQTQLTFDSSSEDGVSASAQSLLKSLWIHMRAHFGDSKDTIGMNIAAIERLQSTLSER